MDYSKNFRKIPIAIMTGISSIAYAQDEVNLDKFLKDFHENPKATMDKIPTKKQVSGNKIIETQFSEEDIKSRSFVEKKDKFRNTLMKNASKRSRSFKPFSEYQGNDNPKYVIDNPATFIDNINAIDAKKISSYTLTFQPWSGSYWPLYKGNITNRYSENLPDMEINDYANYILRQRSADTMVSEGKTNYLSPAEKYDLLMGDSNYSLTNTIIADAQSYGKFEGWEGICHGWAPAAYMHNRPVRSVNLTNAAGTKITFYPSDIKALSTILWANLSAPTKFIGGRCNQKNPATDSNGRITSQECFDTNPGTFHLTLINQLGINNRSVVIDATYDFQVWNQPLLGYKYRYFNPQTRVVGATAKEAAIPRSQFTRDKFTSYRSNYAAKIVGVETTIQYIGETWPNAATKDSHRNDNVISVTYVYDLELDSSDRIIGGEWYQNAHPDFIWTPSGSSDVSTGLVPNSTTASYNYNIYKWNENPTRPDPEWTIYSPYAAQRKVPLENVVRSLIAWSSVDDDARKVPENCPQPCIPSTYKWHRY